MSDLFQNHIVGFPTRRLKCHRTQSPSLVIFDKIVNMNSDGGHENILE